MANLLTWLRGLTSGRREALSGAFNYDDALRYLLGRRESFSGQVVTTDTALQVSAVLACVRAIADGIATVPLKMYQRDPSGSRVELTDHPLASVFGDVSNIWQNGVEYRETLAFHTILTGDHFAFINRTRKGVAELLPIPPGQVCVEKSTTGTALSYRVTFNGSTSSFSPDEIWHVRGPSWNGWRGLQPVHMAREAVGLALATEEHHASLHKNGARPGGLYSVEGSLGAEEYKALREWINQNVEGADNAFKTMILDRSAKFQPLAMTGVDSQHLETRKFQIEEICRHFGVPPTVIGAGDKTSTYASAEQMFLAFAVHTIRPWHRRIEAAIRKDLLTQAERDNGLYPKFIDTELLRANAADRAAFYKAALGSGGAMGWMTQNEVRALEELPAHPDGNNLPQPPVAAPTQGATNGNA